jgi:hypothetical protein
VFLAGLQLFTAGIMVIAIIIFGVAQRRLFLTLNKQFEINDALHERLKRLEQGTLTATPMLMLACPRVADLSEPGEGATVARCNRCNEEMWLLPEDQQRLETTPMMIHMCTPCVMATSINLDHASPA